jgi:hypothetical protein
MINFQESPLTTEKDRAAELLRLITQKAEKEVLNTLATGKSFSDQFLGEVSQEIDRLQSASETILQREFRQELIRLVTTLRAIVNSCWQDSNNINQELALASIVRDIADAVDEYGGLVSLHNGRTRYDKALSKLEIDIKETRLPWARQLLERMTKSDEAPAAERLELSSAFFKRK